MRNCLILALLSVVCRLSAMPNHFAEPVINVRATQPLAAEPAGTDGQFTISREGDTNAAVTVSFALTGSASNGVDYATVPTSVTLAAGQLTTNIVIAPVAEPSATGLKKAILTLEREKGSYIEGALRRAIVYIVYNYTNSPPSVTVVSPRNGASYLSLPNIELAANAFDSNGWVTTVEFFANGNAIATVTNADFCSGPVPLPVFRQSRRLIVPIWPGARSARFQFVWTQVPPGNYAITAVATDNAGLTSSSAAVNISVSTNLPTPEVRIINPMDGAIFSEYGAINIMAAASESNGVIDVVQFYANNNLIGSATNYLAAEPALGPGPFEPANLPMIPARLRWYPFYYRWTNAPIGSNTLTAVAIDNNGTTATSASVNINVTTNRIWRRW